MDYSPLFEMVLIVLASSQKKKKSGKNAFLPLCLGLFTIFETNKFPLCRENKKKLDWGYLLIFQT